MKCPICFCEKLQDKFDNYFVCSECKTMFLKKFPSSNLIKQNNDSDAGDRVSTNSEEVSPIYLQRLKDLRKFSKGKKILDVGFGNGVFMNEARRAGYEVFGVEKPKELIDYMTKNGFKVYRDMNSFKKSSMDAVVNFDVIEHTTSPDLFLQEISAVLKKGGTIMVTTPNAQGISGKFMRKSYFVFDPKKHYILFSTKSIVILLRRNGFKVNSLTTDIITPWFMPTDNVFNRILNKIVYLVSLPLQKSLFRARLGDNTQIIATKI